MQCLDVIVYLSGHVTVRYGVDFNILSQFFYGITREINFLCTYKNMKLWNKHYYTHLVAKLWVVTEDFFHYLCSAEAYLWPYNQ